MLGFQIGKFSDSVKDFQNQNLMGSKDSFGDGLCKIRPHLADVTNRPLKRPLSLVSGDGGDSQLSKQMCFGSGSLAKSKSHMQIGTQAHLNNDDTELLQTKEKHPILLPLCDDTSQLCREPGMVSELMEEQKPLDLENFKVREKGKGIVITERAVEIGDKGVCEVENLESPNSGSLQVPTSSASHDSNFMGLKPCLGHKGDSGGNTVNDVVDLKSCTCSFCSKAAYIWSDLHYQDAKGRLSAIKKSQKEAKAIIQKFSGLEATVMHDQHQSEESLQLELSLVQQWKSLFVQMQNMYAQESSQLESSFEELKDLRENCKNDLELNDNSYCENQ